MDHEGMSWYEMSDNPLDQEEVIAARFKEIRDLHAYEAYEKVPEEECCQSTAKRPVQV